VEAVTAGTELRPAAQLRRGKTAHRQSGGAESSTRKGKAMAYVYGTTSSDILNADDGITSGDDTVYAGDGHDTIRGLGGHDILYGEDGRDTIYGGDGVDWLDGGKNDDSLFGGDDNDYLFGQDGDDELDGGNNDDYLDGGAGADTLDGGNGNDIAAYFLSEEGVHVSLNPAQWPGSGNSGGDAEGDTLVNIENLAGSRYDDELYGNDHVNALWGMEGNDFIHGGRGGDLIDGGDGIDTVSYEGSTEGVDVWLKYDSAWGGDAAGDQLDSIENLIGSAHGDTLGGDDGDNVLSGLDGENHLYGYGGIDVLWGGDDKDSLDGGEDADVLKGFGGDDFLIGGDEADTMWGGAGNDLYSVDDAGDEVTEFAGQGSDTVWASIIDYTLGDQVENLTLSNIGGLNGTGNDLDNVIVGNDNTNLLNGGGGDDTIAGNAGDDIIDGGTGADTMLGGQDYDIFIVDDANDLVLEYAGEGFDQVQTSVSYSLAAGSEVEVLYADPATTTAAINLTGNELDNIVVGNDGINVLVGGLGVDTLRGNGGADAFLWSSIDEVGLASPDIVADYSGAQGDVLHFTNIDADETIAGNQDFTFIGTAAFTAAGQINWFSNGTDTFIQLNTDADAAAEGMIQLSGVVSGDSVLMFL
jgi:Ca2+-binding RTX toxin-like protein